MIDKTQEIVKINKRIKNLEDLVKNRVECENPLIDCEDLNS